MLCIAKVCLWIMLQFNAAYVPVTSGIVAEINNRSFPGHVLVAHDDLAGQYFFNTYLGETITYNGNDYVIDDFGFYQALIPNSPASDLVNMETGEQLDVRAAYHHLYYYDGLVLQTCITINENPRGGRFFVFAERLE